MKKLSITAVDIGGILIAGIFVAHVAVTKGCYGASVGTILLTWAIFVLPSMVLPIIGLFISKPTEAIGSLLVFAAVFFWLGFRECTSPYAGGGANMAYLILLFWGFPLGIAGFICGWAFKKL